MAVCKVRVRDAPLEGSWMMRGVARCIALSGRGPIANTEILDNATVKR